MLYGPEKVREIARSILPSTSRRAARQNAAMVKRANRRRTRQTLHEWAKYIDPYEFEGHIFDYGEPGGGCNYGWWDLGTIKEVMWHRRNYDKLGAFLRWADAHTAHLETNEERYMAVKRAMPDSLIGRHALTHLGRDYDIDDPYKYGRLAWQLDDDDA